MHRGLVSVVLSAVTVAVAVAPVAGAELTPHTPSQKVPCEEVDPVVGALPRGDGDGKVTEDEVGPDGWRFSRFGMSVVTVAYRLDRNGTADNPDDDVYKVAAGRSGTGANEQVVNGYPEKLDISQPPLRELRHEPQRFWYSAADLDVPKKTLREVLTFEGKKATLVLTGTRTTRPRAFRFPGRGIGAIRVPLRDPEGDGTYTGCAASAELRAHALQVGTKKKGEILQRAFVKVHASVDDDGRVDFLEYTEISTFKKAAK